MGSLVILGVLVVECAGGLVAWWLGVLVGG